MIFHLANELPVQEPAVLDHESKDLTWEEIRILKTQIRRNTVLIDDFVNRLDLMINKEKYPHRAVFIHKIRRRLELLMEENDTFRNVLWKHYQKEEILRKCRAM
ncbi:MAG: hypothetical protein HYZ85_04820 [Candidatus Omnitrophica bacterium]|nr:hypothetical protein [Candidatus Omnitrophota bacterium]